MKNMWKLHQMWRLNLWDQRHDQARPQDAKLVMGDKWNGKGSGHRPVLNQRVSRFGLRSLSGFLAMMSKKQSYSTQELMLLNCLHGCTTLVWPRPIQITGFKKDEQLISCLKSWVCWILGQGPDQVQLDFSCSTSYFPRGKKSDRSSADWVK